MAGFSGDEIEREFQLDQVTDYWLGGWARSCPWLGYRRYRGLDWKAGNQDGVLEAKWDCF